MTQDLPTLRKHEAALVDLRADIDFYAPDARDKRWLDALDYALSRLREDIARACIQCDGSGLAMMLRCPVCHGTGKRPTEVT